MISEIDLSGLRIILVRMAKDAKVSRGLNPDLTPPELDAIALAPIECARTRCGYNFRRGDVSLKEGGA